MNNKMTPKISDLVKIIDFSVIEDLKGNFYYNSNPVFQSDLSVREINVDNFYKLGKMKLRRNLIVYSKKYNLNLRTDSSRVEVIDIKHF